MHFSEFAPTPGEEVGTTFPITTLEGSWKTLAPPRVHRCANEHLTEFWPLEATFRLPTLSQKELEGMLPRGCHATKCA